MTWSKKIFLSLLLLVLVPLSALAILTPSTPARPETTAKNSSLVVATAVDTSVLTLSLGVVNAGDRILVSSRLGGTKGGTAGFTRARIAQTSGTATVQFGVDLGANGWEVQESSTPASASVIFALGGLVRVTGTGTLVLTLSAQSGGSDLTVFSGSAQAHALGLAR